MNPRKDKIKYTLWLKEHEAKLIEQHKEKPIMIFGRALVLADIVNKAIQRGDLNK